MADITLPQLGETVTEGTITRWFKKVGDTVAADEPLFEVSTDKVDTEVPSPVAGTVTEIRVNEGDTVPVGTVIAVVGAANAAAAPAPVAPAPAPAQAPAPVAKPAPAPTPVAQPAPAPAPVAQPAPAARPAAAVATATRTAIA
ncbi:MAG: biotin/lipoyl-containing protein, partial [Acidimicrobiaceae bacterium]